MNWPIRPFSLKAMAFSLEAADVIWILGAAACFTKFASLDSQRESNREPRGDVVGIIPGIIMTCTCLL